jgi:hypothetical protein
MYQMGAINARAGAAIASALVTAISVYSLPANAADAPDLAGVYWAIEYRARVEPVGGGELPFTQEGRAAYERNMAGLLDGSIVDEARKRCNPDGPLRSHATPYPFEIVQAPPGQVLIIHELNRELRIVALDQPLPPYEEVFAYPWYSGHSVGHYEGDTLVVESIGFNTKTYLDATGAPHTGEMVTTERIRRIGPTELEIVVTVHDPEYYAMDWDARFTYELRNDARIQDYFCGGEHRDISHIPGINEARQARTEGRLPGVTN